MRKKIFHYFNNKSRAKMSKILSFKKSEMNVDGIKREIDKEGIDILYCKNNNNNNKIYL